MVRRVRTAQVDVDVPEWVLEYHPSPAYPTVQAWFLAVREYVEQTSLLSSSVPVWMFVMSNAHAQRATSWPRRATSAAPRPQRSTNA